MFTILEGAIIEFWNFEATLFVNLELRKYFGKIDLLVLFTKVRSCYRVKPGGPKNFLLEVKTITKSPGNGICESVKSCNLDKKRQNYLVLKLKNDFK